MPWLLLILIVTQPFHPYAYLTGPCHPSERHFPDAPPITASCRSSTNVPIVDARITDSNSQCRVLCDSFSNPAITVTVKSVDCSFCDTAQAADFTSFRAYTFSQCIPRAVCVEQCGQELPGCIYTGTCTSQTCFTSTATSQPAQILHATHAGPATVIAVPGATTDLQFGSPAFANLELSIESDPPLTERPPLEELSPKRSPSPVVEGPSIPPEEVEELTSGTVEGRTVDLAGFADEILSRDHLTVTSPPLDSSPEAPFRPEIDPLPPTFVSPIPTIPPEDITSATAEPDMAGDDPSVDDGDEATVWTWLGIVIGAVTAAIAGVSTFIVTLVKSRSTAADAPPPAPAGTAAGATGAAPGDGTSGTGGTAAV